MIHLIDRGKKERLVEKIDTHLRRTARQLIKFNTLQETLNYLIDSFWEQFTCDYVSILLKDSEYLFNRSHKGTSPYFEQQFPLELASITEEFLDEPLCNYDFVKTPKHCALLRSIEAEGFSAWFTVPIKENAMESYGVCVIGFRRNVLLLSDVHKLFIEFGNDIAVAINLAIHKEQEKRKIKGIEWVKDNLLLGESTENLMEGIVEQAGEGTNADSASVYLYDEWNHCLIYQPPAFGSLEVPVVIDMMDTFQLSDLFPGLEKAGGQEMTVPLVVNLKTIGVLHVSRSLDGPAFDGEDLNFLRLLSSHVSVLIENARLYRSEQKDKSRLEQMMVHHQELVKQTLVGEDFSGLTKTLSHLLHCSVLLLDRFMRPIAHFLREDEQGQIQQIIELIEKEKNKNLNIQKEHWIRPGSADALGIWPIVGGGEGLGYLCLKKDERQFDMLLRITINQALNVFAIQFIKQKLVLEVKEQVKGSFLDQLFAEKITNKGKVLEYCNLFNLNLFEPHKLSIFTFITGEEEPNLIKVEGKKTWIVSQLRDHLLQWDPGLVLARKEGNYLIFVSEKEDTVKEDYWQNLYERIKRIIKLEFPKGEVYMGISDWAREMEDYHSCYKQALQTLRIVSERFPHKGYMSFDRLGSYTVLYNIQDPFVVQAFCDKYLKPLLDSGDKGRDLFDTLRAYVYWNGNLKETAESLFIHRSSLKYRLEKIRDLLNVDLGDVEERFNVMLAYKLYDLYE